MTFLRRVVILRVLSLSLSLSVTSIGSDALLERAFRYLQTRRCSLCHLKVYYEIQNTLFYCRRPAAAEFLNLPHNVLLSRNWKMESPRVSLGHHYRSSFEDWCITSFFFINNNQSCSFFLTPWDVEYIYITISYQEK